MHISPKAAASLLALSAVAVTFLVWQSRHSRAGAPGGGTSASHGPVAGDDRGAKWVGLPPGTVATHALPPNLDPGRLAEAPSVWLRVRDHATGRPVGGAVVRRLSNGADLAFTDPEGLVGVPLPEPEELAVVMDSYLLRLVPAQAGTTEAAPLTVSLVHDAWSWWRRFQFVAPDGSEVEDVFVRLQPEPVPAGKRPVPSGDPVLASAWSEHVQLAGRSACPNTAPPFGSGTWDRALRLAAGQHLRFVAAGDYLVEASTLSGLVGTGRLRIEGDPARRAEALTVALLPGAYLKGTVVDRETGAPLAGAVVVPQGGDPLGLQATTDGTGSFVLGPLAPGERYIEARRDSHDPSAEGPTPVPGASLRIGLRERPPSTSR